MASAGGGGPRKRQRVGSSTRLSSSSASYSGDGTLTESLRSIPGGFNDYNTADVLLRLQIESSAIAEDIDLHLHSHALRRSNYFAALLSDRWHHLEQDQDSEPEHSPGNRLLRRLNLKIPASTEEPHLTVLRLLYSADFSDVILDASVALSLLPVALQLLFDDCIRACLQFLEAVPWSEEEENAVLGLIPLLGVDESRELLARVSPRSRSSSEEMLQRLITASIGSHPYVASAKVKGFASKMLRDYPSRDCVRRVFDRAFEASLKTVKESLENYSSPDLRGDHDETEAIQRLNLHTAVYHGKDLFWLLERMIELRVADKAVKAWSDQTTFVADLQRAFQEDVWRNIAPGLPALVLRSTARLADAVASGSVLAPREVRLKLVSVWLPVLIVCREKNVSPIPSGQKVLYQELEEIFLRIISTLPMSDAEVLLHQCLSFATRNVDDCPHLVSAYNTWFRRATRPPDS